MKTINNKVVAISGAGSGIGRATAVAMAKRGAIIAASDIDQDGLQQTRQLCTAAGADCAITLLDVADREGVYAWAERTQQQFGKVNIIVNNAGVSVSAVADDISYADFEWIMSINFWGVVYGSKAFLPYLKQSGDGHIVNISSLLGLIAMPATGAYSAAKFAVRGFTEALTEELAIDQEPVKVTLVYPGGVATNIARTGRVTPNNRWQLVDSETSARKFEKMPRLTPDAAAQQIINAVLTEKRRLLIGKDAKIVDFLQRHLPVAYQYLLEFLTKRGRKQSNNSPDNSR